MSNPVLIDALQLAGFLFGGWLLFRFTDWIYRRGHTSPRRPDHRIREISGAPSTPAPPLRGPVVDGHARHRSKRRRAAPVSGSSDTPSGSLMHRRDRDSAPVSRSPKA
jgi:hypothetical protein